MKAQICNLFDTARKVIAVDDEFSDAIRNFDELRKCENVIIGKRIKGLGTEAIIDDQFVYVNFLTVSCPADGGTMRIAEVY